MSLLNDDGKKYPNKGLEALAKEAPEVVKRMGYRDGESVVDSLNANPRVILNGLDAAINSKMLDLEDAQKNKDVEQVEKIGKEINELDRQRILLKNEISKERPAMAMGGLLDDERMQYGLGGTVAEKIARLLVKQEKLQKELSTEQMSPANQKKQQKEINNISNEVENLQASFVNNPEQLKDLSVDDAMMALKKLEKDKRDIKNMPEVKMYGEAEKAEVIKEIDADYADSISVLKEIIGRKTKAEGGEVDEQMSMLMQNQEPPMESDEEMEDNYLDFILDEALSEEEEDMLMSKLEQDEQLSMLFDKVVEVASEFAGSGPVEGPGTGVSDSIPARLSDGEFVFTAKAVEEIGADELMRMMKDAEMRADERQGMANGGEMDEEENVVVRDVDEPVTQNINVTKTTVDSPAKSMEDEDEITKNIRTNMMMRKSPDHVRS